MLELQHTDAVVGGGEPTHSDSPRNFLVWHLDTSHAGKALSPGQTGTVGHYSMGTCHLVIWKNFLYILKQAFQSLFEYLSQVYIPVQRLG